MDKLFSLLEMSLKLLQRRVLIVVIITDALDVDVWYVGWYLPLMGRNGIHRIFDSSISHVNEMREEEDMGMSGWLICSDWLNRVLFAVNTLLQSKMPRLVLHKASSHTSPKRP